MVLDEKSLEEYAVDVVLQGSLHGPTLFPLYIDGFPDVSCNFATNTDNTAFYSKCLDFSFVAKAIVSY